VRPHEIPQPPTHQEWERGTPLPYMFGYGSLVYQASLEATIGRAVAPEEGPHPVRLQGFRRRWNVAAHSSLRPDYAFVDGAGSPWQGWLVFLGIERVLDAVTLGAVYRLTDADVALLDVRERSYSRITVTGCLDGGPGLGSEPVHTYLPRPQFRAQARHVVTAGTVMARYLRLVDAGYRSLGADLYAEHLATFPPVAPFRVDEITAGPVDPGLPNQAVDPATG
jgi:hypothetical protein